MGKMDEMIIVAPRKEVFDNEKLKFQGVEKDPSITSKITANMSRSYSVMRRGDAEENPSYKQPIPYVTLQRGNEVFVYKRLTGGGEKRLHNQLSLGVGGHCNNIEGLDFFSVIAESMKRELDEELYVDLNKLTLNTVGLINDDENSVGKVHLGLLTVAELDEDSNVSVRETDQLEGQWVSVEDLKNPEIYDNLETWSQFVADILN